MRPFLIAALALLGFAVMDVRHANASVDWREEILGMRDYSSEDSGERRRPTSARSTRSEQAGLKARRGGKRHEARRTTRTRVATPTRPERVASLPKPQRSQRSNRVIDRSGDMDRSFASPGSTYQSGVASYYWQPQRVASGGWFNPNAMTAAHKTLPFGTKVRVTHLGTGRSVDVSINDRGPYIAGRIIDLSSAAAGVIGMKGSGVAKVKVDVLGRN